MWPTFSNNNSTQYGFQQQANRQNYFSTPYSAYQPPPPPSFHSTPSHLTMYNTTQSRPNWSDYFPRRQQQSEVASGYHQAPANTSSFFTNNQGNYFQMPTVHSFAQFTSSVSPNSNNYNYEFRPFSVDCQKKAFNPPVLTELQPARQLDSYWQFSTPDSGVISTPSTPLKSSPTIVNDPKPSITPPSADDILLPLAEFASLSLSDRRQLTLPPKRDHPARKRRPTETAEEHTARLKKLDHMRYVREMRKKEKLANEVAEKENMLKKQQSQGITKRGRPRKTVRFL